MSAMHVRYCDCEACLPGFPVYVPPPKPRRIYASTRERKSAQNARAYMRRKLRGASA